MNEINTLLGLNTGNDKAKALADQLRNQQLAGQFYGLSTSKPVANFGQNLASSAVNTAKSGGVLNRAMEQEQQRQAELQASNQAKVNAAKLIADEKMIENQRDQANWEAEQRAKVDAAKLKANEQSNKRDIESYWHPTKKGTVLNLKVAPDGNHYDDKGTDITLNC